MAETTGNIEARTVTVPSIVGYYTDEQLNSEYHSKIEYQQAIDKYGVIYKIVNFSDLEKPEDIQASCREWIRRNYYDGVLSFTVKAVDLHLLGFDKDKIMVGDQVTVEFLDLYPEPVTKTLTCMSIQYDIMKPENSSYKIGVPEISSNIKYRNGLAINTNNSKKSGATSSGTGNFWTPFYEALKFRSDMGEDMGEVIDL